MSDSLRRYRAIRDALLQLYPATLTARQAHHLTTLAALVSGIVGSRQTQLPAIASKLVVSGLGPERSMPTCIAHCDRHIGSA